MQKYVEDLRAKSFAEKQQHIEQLCNATFSKKLSVSKKHHFVCVSSYYLRLAYEHTQESQLEAQQTQKTRSDMNKIYLRYVQNIQQAMKFISERKELSLSVFKALYTLNVQQTMKSKSLTWDLISDDNSEIRQLLQLQA